MFLWSGLTFCIHRWLGDFTSACVIILVMWHLFQKYWFLNLTATILRLCKMLFIVIIQLMKVVTANSFFSSLWKKPESLRHMTLFLWFRLQVFIQNELKRVLFNPFCRQKGQQQHAAKCSRDRKRFKWTGCAFLRSITRQQLTAARIWTGRVRSSARRYSFCGGVSKTWSYFFASMFQHTLSSSASVSY